MGSALIPSIYFPTQLCKTCTSSLKLPQVSASFSLKSNKKAQNASPHCQQSFSDSKNHKALFPWLQVSKDCSYWDVIQLSGVTVCWILLVRNSCALCSILLALPSPARCSTTTCASWKSTYCFVPGLHLLSNKSIHLDHTYHYCLCLQSLEQHQC